MELFHKFLKGHFLLFCKEPKSLASSPETLKYVKFEQDLKRNQHQALLFTEAVLTARLLNLGYKTEIEPLH